MDGSFNGPGGSVLGTTLGASWPELQLVGIVALEPLATESPWPVEKLAERPIEEVIHAYMVDAAPDLPWQVAPATIAAATPPSRVLALDAALAAALALVDLQPASVVLRALVVPRHLRRQGYATRLVRALRARFADRALRVLPLVPENLVGTIPTRVGAAPDELAELELEREL